MIIAEVRKRGSIGKTCLRCFESVNTPEEWVEKYSGEWERFHIWSDFEIRRREVQENLWPATYSPIPVIR